MSGFMKCPHCKAFFESKEDLDEHCRVLHGAAVVLNAEKVALSSTALTEFSESIPTVVAQSISNTSVPIGNAVLVAESIPPVPEKSKPLPPPVPSTTSTKKKKGFENMFLATIAEDSEDLLQEYESLKEDKFGKKIFTPEMIQSINQKLKDDSKEVVQAIARSQTVSICFLVDTTGSMSPYIEGVKRTIQGILTGLRHSGCTVGGIAFVGYKDWCDGNNHFEVLPFTSNKDEFVKYLTNSVHATGGGDTCEDVLGGLYKAVEGLEWKSTSGTRILFHLADAPAHGRKFYSSGEQKEVDYGRWRGMTTTMGYSNSPDDDYPDGHAQDPDVAELFKKMNIKEIDYYFGKIDANLCDRMIQVFEEYYHRPIPMFDVSSSGSYGHGRGMTDGKINSKIASAVSKTIGSSVARSCAKSISSSRRKGLAERTYTIDKTMPNWDTLPIYEASIVHYTLPEDIENITSFTAPEQQIKTCRIQVAPNPFDNGAVRLAYYGKIHFKGGPLKKKPAEGGAVISDEEKSSVEEELLPTSDMVVLKEFLTLPSLPELDRQRYMVDLEVQTVASKLALDFNGQLSKTPVAPEVKLKFLMAKVLRIKMPNPDGNPASPPVYRMLAYEKFMIKDGLAATKEGSSKVKSTESSSKEDLEEESPSPAAATAIAEDQMIKYTNNLNYVVNPLTLPSDIERLNLKLALAFSHYTYCVTKEYLLVSDLQGISTKDSKGNSMLLLTDPAIHCPAHGRFGKTNLRFEGVKAFFRKHVCNEYCQALGLTPPSFFNSASKVAHGPSPHHPPADGPAKKVTAEK